MTTLLSLFAILAPFCPLCLGSRSSSSVGGRYSFSLSTFDQNGRLAQVERAALAASLGPPVVAVSLSNGAGCVLASLFSTPSPLVNDDGTARFVRITDNIVVAHSGVSGDGRAVAAAAQRLAVEHAYTFADDGSDEEMIPIDFFLEEMSGLFQKYTMKPGSRPFGCSLLVAHIPNDDNTCSGSSSGSSTACCRLYRIDPSGMVRLVEPICCIGGGGEGGGVADKIVEQLEERCCAQASSLEEAERILLEVMRDVLSEEGDANAVSDSQNFPGHTFLSSTLTRTRGLLVRKMHPPQQEEER